MFHALPSHASLLLGMTLLAIVEACGAAEGAVALPAPVVDIPKAAGSGLQMLMDVAAGTDAPLTSVADALGLSNAGQLKGEY